MDTDKLVQPLSEAQPCGANLEDTQLLASFDAFRIFGQSTPLPADVDWREIRSHSLEALQESKDLRLLAHLAVAELRIDGLSAFIDLLAVAAGWLEAYWAQVYPLVDDDAILRRNALNGLADPMAVLDALRRIPLVAQRQLGEVSFRALDIAAGRQSVPEGESPGLNEDQIRAIFAATPPDELLALSARLQAALTSLEKIAATMLEQGGGTEGVPDFGPLQSILARMSVTVKTNLPAEGTGEAGAEGGNAPDGAGAAGVPGAIRTRDDAVRMLGLVADFFRRTEPSSPVPIFLDRAKRLVALDFLKLIEDVAPDALSEVKRLGGIKDQE
ncbi:MAG TPA: type VI secretion system protein TssA [Steroidobacteraceae bacterium]|nr:type VI secretion system protein TssA [Steroidobacteraceae bacterium]